MIERVPRPFLGSAYVCRIAAGDTKRASPSVIKDYRDSLPGRRQTLSPDGAAS